jgi:hypothetical protein
MHNHNKTLYKIIILVNITHAHKDEKPNLVIYRNKQYISLFGMIDQIYDQTSLHQIPILCASTIVYSSLNPHLSMLVGFESSMPKYPNSLFPTFINLLLLVHSPIPMCLLELSCYYCSLLPFSA